MMACLCVCVEKCTCWNYCLIVVVGLAMVVVCTYWSNCIPWADMVQIVAVSLHEGYEMYYVDREQIVHQGWPTAARRKATWSIRTCLRAALVYTCMNEGEREHWGLRNLIVITNFYFFWASYYFEYLEIILRSSFTPWLIAYLVEGGFRALAERSAQIMNACCKLLIYPVVVNSSFCSLHRDIGAENWHKIWNIFMNAESLHLLTLQCVAASRVA